MLAYTPGGEVDYYTDPNGKTDYTWDPAGRLDFLLDPASKKTDYDYNNNDKRTKTVYPGGTTQTVTLDQSSRPKAIKAVSGTTTLVDLAYTYGYGTGGATDGTKIRTRTHNATKLATSYTYDSQGRLSYTKEADAAGTRKASWLYCYDKAGNLTHYDSSAASCPITPTFGYNDASQLISRNGSTDGWAYDKSGNELAATPGTGFARSSETWSDHSQLKTITTSGTARDAVHAGTDNSERTKLGDTWFHTTALGLTGTTTAGTDTGFIREPAGTLNSASSTQQAHAPTTTPTTSPAAPAPSLNPSPSPTGSPASTAIRPGCTRWAPATTTPTSDASPSPTPPDRRPTLTSTPSATRSTTPIRRAPSRGAVSVPLYRSSVVPSPPGPESPPPSAREACHQRLPGAQSAPAWASSAVASAQWMSANEQKIGPDNPHLYRHWARSDRSSSDAHELKP